MGCDGGTIPKRKEIVKNKRKDQARDKDADLSAKWQYCSLSGLKLKKPIVACQLGKLYNRIAIVEHLLERQQAPSSSSRDAPPASKSTDPILHIKCLRDTKELKLKEKDDSEKSTATSSTTNQSESPYVCPISGLELGGKYKFYYLFSCGCIFSERALKQVPNEKQCIICYQPYEPEMDLIVLNGDKEEIEELKRRISIRKERILAAKKLKKRANTEACGSSSVKRHKKEKIPTAGAG